MNYDVYINEKSGSIKRYGESGLVKELSTILGAQLRNVYFLSPEKLRKALENCDQSLNLLIGGGDGTLASAAEILGKNHIPFGILPLGTMNLFSKDVGLPVDPLESARLYQGGCRALQFDTGRINGHIFLCNAVIGVTTDLAQRRERDRNQKGILKWLLLGKDTMRRLSGDQYYPLTISCNGEEERKLIKAAIISNNIYESGSGIASFKKKSLKEGMLGIYIVTPEGTLQSLNLLASMALGSWQQDHCIEIRESCAVDIETMRPTITVMIDGEPKKMRGPLHFYSDPGSLSLLIPDGVER